jgi:type I restriction enzyme S subunit
LIDNNAMAAIPDARVESRFLFHFLQTVDFYRLASATTVPALRKSELNRLLVPLPSLLEQRRIAEIPDKADELRAQRRAALAQLDILTQSIFLDLFGDPATNPKKFPIAKMGDLCDVRDGTHDSPKYVSDGVSLQRT